MTPINASCSNTMLPQESYPGGEPMTPINENTPGWQAEGDFSNTTNVQPYYNTGSQAVL